MNRIEQHEFNVYDKKRKFSGYISLGICAFCFMVAHLSILSMGK